MFAGVVYGKPVLLYTPRNVSDRDMLVHNADFVSDDYGGACMLVLCLLLFTFVFIK